MAASAEPVVEGSRKPSLMVSAARADGAAAAQSVATSASIRSAAMAAGAAAAAAAAAGKRAAPSAGLGGLGVAAGRMRGPPRLSGTRKRNAAADRLRGLKRLWQNGGRKGNTPRSFEWRPPIGSPPTIRAAAVGGSTPATVPRRAAAPPTTARATAAAFPYLGCPVVSMIAPHPPPRFFPRPSPGLFGLPFFNTRTFPLPALHTTCVRWLLATSRSGQGTRYPETNFSDLRLLNRGC
eukprot:SM000131S26738  [mRNA]  locus=s131:205209:206549:- [translate_table: standard]